MSRAIMRGDVEVVSPVMGLPSPVSPSVAPRRKSFRYSMTSNKPDMTMIPLKDDSRLVALRYDQTVALEPPIPLPPPRSPLRQPRHSFLRVPPHGTVNSPAVALGHAVPPRRPPPPTEKHPALRTISTPRTIDFDTRRDSVYSVQTSAVSSGSGSYIYHGLSSNGDENEFDVDNDNGNADSPFAYESISEVLGVQPLRLRPHSACSSIYSFHEQGPDQINQEIENRGHDLRKYRGRDTGFDDFEFGFEGGRVRARESRSAGGLERVSANNIRPSGLLAPTHGSGSGNGDSCSTGSNSWNAMATKRSMGNINSKIAAPILPASPVTPPHYTSSSATAATGTTASTTTTATIVTTAPASTSVSSSSSNNCSFSKRFGRGTIHPSPPSMNRLRKKSLVRVGVDAGNENTSSSSSSGGGNGDQRDKTTTLPSSPLLHHPGRSHLHPKTNSNYHSSASTNPINTANPDRNASISDPSSPTISTKIPCESFFEDDDLNKISFSIRGSLIFGSKRLWKTASGSSGSSSTVDRKMADQDQHSRPRLFSLHPAAPRNPGIAPARPPREDDMGIAAMLQTLPPPESPHIISPPRSPSVFRDTASISTPRRVPPSIRIISAEAEKESQKVRSLYESAACFQFGDGDMPLSPGGTLEPHPEVEVLSGVDANDAPRSQPHGPRPQTSATMCSVARHVSHELGGPIEDWDGIEVRDVDRYGFIVPHRRESASPPTATQQSGSPSGRHSSYTPNTRSMSKDGPPISLNTKGSPHHDISSRSLHTHTSEISTVSRRSVRATIRHATNRLPHNRDRRLLDKAGDLLALQPGLSQNVEDEPVEKMSAELKRKEATRSDKWRKMAKVVKSGSEGQGTIFHFDTKNPKLVSRTWKGIPDCWRAAAWYSFLATSAMADPINYVPDEELKSSYSFLVEESSPDDTQIDLDVPRTINQHIMFRRRYRGGQRLLFRVLHAMSLYFPETGYVQGMAPLAATFLSYYEEEQCFIMLVRLWQFRGLNRIYQSGFVELMGTLKDFETQWLNDKDAAENLRELGIDPTAYATRWYLTLFNLSIPFHVQLRVWDVFMLLGSTPPEVLDSSSVAGKDVDDYPSSAGLEILHATSLAIIDTLHATLIDSDFENAMKSLTSWVPIKDEHRFLEVVQVEWKKHQSRQKRKG